MLQTHASFCITIFNIYDHFICNKMSAMLSKSTVIHFIHSVIKRNWFKNYISVFYSQLLFWHCDDFPLRLAKICFGLMPTFPLCRQTPGRIKQNVPQMKHYKIMNNMKAEIYNNPDPHNGVPDSCCEAVRK